MYNSRFETSKECGENRFWLCIFFSRKAPTWWRVIIIIANAFIGFLQRTTATTTFGNNKAATQEEEGPRLQQPFLPCARTVIIADFNSPRCRSSVSCLEGVISHK
jgi:hypothetical protein